MRMMTFAGRTLKEILRDPLYMAFGIGFPLGILLLLTAIQANIPVTLFEIEKLTPGIAVFGLSFMTLFAAMLVSKDRSGALIQRLYTTPLTAADYICGYMLPLLPIGFAQTIVCYSAAAFLGLKITVHVVYAVLMSIPVSLFFIALGLLCGTVFNDKQASGICGPLLTNLAAWLSGAWFDLNLVGGVFKKAADVLPFSHSVELQRMLLAGNAVSGHLWWVLGYAFMTVLIAVTVFTRRMKSC
ncbi:ABC transporter permease [Anaerolentibacter hominis]|uniref:ABC transporter permease n=1 Tax=Anaerolentibacter hominis TaxID=3079009 RepID=UPI0031B80B8C